MHSICKVSCWLGQKYRKVTCYTDELTCKHAKAASLIEKPFLFCVECDGWDFYADYVCESV